MMAVTFNKREDLRLFISDILIEAFGFCRDFKTYIYPDKELIIADYIYIYANHHGYIFKTARRF